MTDREALADRDRVIAQLSGAARAFARGDDGTSMVPLAIRARVERWKHELGPGAAALDEEAWLFGLLTLACLELGRPVRLPDLPGARSAS